MKNSSQYSDEERIFILKSLFSILTPSTQAKLQIIEKFLPDEYVKKFVLHEYDEGTDEHFRYFKNGNSNFQIYKYCLKYPELDDPYLYLTRGLNNEDNLCFKEVFKIEEYSILIKIYHNIHQKNVKIPLLIKIREYVPDFEKEDNSEFLVFLVFVLIFIVIFK